MNRDLIYPRPNIIKKVKFSDFFSSYEIKTNYNINEFITINQNYDNCMNELLMKVPHEEIFEQMFLQTKI